MEPGLTLGVPSDTSTLSQASAVFVVVTVGVGRSQPRCPFMPVSLPSLSVFVGASLQNTPLHVRLKKREHRVLEFFVTERNYLDVLRYLYRTAYPVSSLPRPCNPVWPCHAGKPQLSRLNRSAWSSKVISARELVACTYLH